MLRSRSRPETHPTRGGTFACTKIYILFVVSMLALGSCTVQYVSRYDEITEESITDIQRNVEHLLQAVERDLGTPEADHEQYKDTYEQLHVDAALLNVRARAIDLNSITAEQSQLLMDWLSGLEELHRTGFSNAEMVAIARQQGEQIFVAMLKFELAKRRQFDPAIIDGG